MNYCECGTELEARQRTCKACQSARRARRDRVRLTPKQRGYGAEHKRERARWAQFVATGKAQCVRCGLWIEPNEPWDLGHVDGDKSQYQGPEHRACNRATSGRRRIRSQQWY